MTRKFATIDAPLADVVALYRNIEEWADWRPSINHIEVLESADERLVAQVNQTLRGRRLKLRMEYRVIEGGFSEHQIDGWLRRWDATWRFQKAPGGGGTVVSMNVDFELGLFGFLVSRRTVNSIIDKMFRLTAREAEARLRGRAAEGAGEAVGGEVSVDGHHRIRIVRTEGGLEVWLDDKRYVALPAE